MRKQLSKILAIVMVLAMAVSMCAVGVYAAETTYVLGDVDLNGTVTVKDATLVQKYAADMVTLDEVQLSVANVVADETVNVKDATAIQKIVDEITDPDQPTKDEAIYIVAGPKSLCGSEWDGTDVNNQMTEKDGIYTITYTALVAGDYQFKIVKDGTERIGPEIGNYAFTVTDTCDVTLTYNPATGEVTYAGDNVTETGFNPEAIYAVGAGDEDWLNNEVWNPAAESNKLTEVADGIYEITYTNVPAFDNYLVKFAANGSWGDSWGGEFVANEEVDAVYNGDNIVVVVDYELADVTLRLDLTNFDYATKLGAKMTITITPVEVAA